MAYEVTIGIPVYNVERYIRLAMDSALAQTFQSIEFLVLDDCGTDSSMDIVREYQQNHPRGKNIRIVRQPQNGGIGNARNRIVEEAKGRYLYHLDGDDAIAPNTIQLLYENAEKYCADIVYGSYERIEEFSENVARKKYIYPAAQFLNEDEFADKVYSDYGFLQANTWNFLIKKKIYLENNVRYSAVNFWEDFSMTIDLPTYVTRVVMLPDITYYYYCRYGSLSNFKKRDRIEKSEILKTIDAMKQVKLNSGHIKNKPYFHKRMYKVMLTHLYMSCSILKNEAIISPRFTNREVRDVMKSPLGLKDILKLRSWRLKNMALYLLGILPPAMSVLIIRKVGIYKGLI